MTPRGKLKGRKCVQEKREKRKWNVGWDAKAVNGDKLGDDGIIYKHVRTRERNVVSMWSYTCADDNACSVF